MFCGKNNIKFFCNLYSRVYGPVEKQDGVFAEVQPMLTSLLDGYIFFQLYHTLHFKN